MGELQQNAGGCAHEHTENTKAVTIDTPIHRTEHRRESQIMSSDSTKSAGDDGGDTYAVSPAAQFEQITLNERAI